MESFRRWLDSLDWPTRLGVSFVFFAIFLILIPIVCALVLTAIDIGVKFVIANIGIAIFLFFVWYVLGKLPGGKGKIFQCCLVKVCVEFPLHVLAAILVAAFPCLAPKKKKKKDDKKDGDKGDKDDDDDD